MSRDSKESAPVLVSACLLGVECRFDGGSKPQEPLRRLAAAGRVLPVCPEQLGGLSTPRRPAEITGGTGAEVLSGIAKVYDDRGCEVTSNYLDGARRCLELAKLAGCHRAVLKERSPSCGVTRIRSGEDILPGQGVSAALLSREGIEVVSDEHPRLTEWIDED